MASGRRPTGLQLVGVGIIAVISLVAAHKLARAVADYSVLAYHYGGLRVDSERLRVVEAQRQRIFVSNGDVLGRGAANAMGGIWAITMFVVSAVLLMVLWVGLRRVAPWLVPEWRDDATKGS